MRTAAFALLAGRDFSRHELGARLRRRGFDSHLVETVVTSLVQEGVLREDRYVEHFVTQHAGRGRGPVRIRMELRQKGVDDEVVSRALEAAGIDWTAAARHTRRRKFGSALPTDPYRRASQARFLQYRGYTPGQIRSALGSDDGDDVEA